MISLKKRTGPVAPEPRSIPTASTIKTADDYPYSADPTTQDCNRPTAYLADTGQLWRFKGKKGRVMAMLAGNPDGVTQWDTLPWHTRLGGTIHAMRQDGLAIATEREGEYRHARYRLRTAGRLLGKVKP
ncbi:hypothetical protein [Sphingomonas sp. 35-24ZXX]|uniref:hypothetical protein n=1 Tax=Sphingomonas sp. 35-24ZXX TaxID=1545915 RepID=UPI0018CCC6C1|nr:hypothetical protein [Sphingomonas sp. 35-24ZXX]